MSVFHRTGKLGASALVGLAAVALGGQSAFAFFPPIIPAETPVVVTPPPITPVEPPPVVPPPPEPPIVEPPVLPPPVIPPIVPPIVPPVVRPPVLPPVDPPITPQETPEPATVVSGLIGLGVMAGGAIRRRRRAA